MQKACKIKLTLNKKDFDDIKRPKIINSHETNQNSQQLLGFQ